ncbi:unnamed protein product [Lampetra fluviatilis]
MDKLTPTRARPTTRHLVCETPTRAPCSGIGRLKPLVGTTGDALAAPITQGQKQPTRPSWSTPPAAANHKRRKTAAAVELTGGWGEMPARLQRADSAGLAPLCARGPAGWWGEGDADAHRNKASPPGVVGNTREHEARQTGPLPTSCA